MKFEFIEFYPNYHDFDDPKILGTVHIRVSEIDLDIRGIIVMKNIKNDLVFNIPVKYSWNKEQTERSRYPVFRWRKQEDQDDMINFLKTEGKRQVTLKLSEYAKKQDGSDA